MQSAAALRILLLNSRLLADSLVPAFFAAAVCRRAEPIDWVACFVLRPQTGWLVKIGLERLCPGPPSELCRALSFCFAFRFDLFVCGTNLNECPIVATAIRMVLGRFLAIRLLDLLGAGVGADLQDLIRVRE